MCLIRRNKMLSISLPAKAANFFEAASWNIYTQESGNVSRYSFTKVPTSFPFNVHSYLILTCT